MTKAPTPLVYDDPKLPVMVQQVVLSVPWNTQPTTVEWPLETFPRLQVPTLSWVIEDSELRWRERFITFMRDYIGEDLTTPITNLPGNYISALLANLFYNSRAYVDCFFPPRIDEELIAHPYACAGYWMGYYLCEFFTDELATTTTNDATYRIKQLGDLRKIFAYMLAATLQDNPVIKADNHVIVGATSTTGLRDIIYVDSTNLSTYLNNGGTVDELTIQWVTARTNPTV